MSTQNKAALAAIRAGAEQHRRVAQRHYESQRKAIEDMDSLSLRSIEAVRSVLRVFPGIAAALSEEDVLRIGRGLGATLRRAAGGQ